MDTWVRIDQLVEYDIVFFYESYIPLVVKGSGLGRILYHPLTDKALVNLNSLASCLEVDCIGNFGADYRERFSKIFRMPDEQ